MWYVYYFTSLVDNALYVGKAKNVVGRFKKHLRDAYRKRAYRHVWMRKILKICPESLFVETVAGPFFCENSAYREERRHIMKHRVTGTKLLNDRDSWGGEGFGTEVSRRGGRKGGQVLWAKLSASERKEFAARGGAAGLGKKKPGSTVKRSAAGKISGKVFWEKLSPEERSEVVRRRSQKAWETRRRKSANCQKTNTI